MMETGYFFPMVKGLEIFAGVLLIFGKYVRVALTILAPIMLNALLAHLFLAPAGLGGALLASSLIIYLTYKEWDGFKELVKQ